MLRVLALVFMLVLPATVIAQSAATLVADRVTIPPGGTQLIAEGNVEVFYEGTRLSAARIVFDDTTDRLMIEGPIFIVTQTGDILTADRADLDPRLENGLLRGARLILAEQLQLAANRIDRVDGRYTQLSRVAATSCHVCAEGDTPLWDIRAARVVHDTEERQLYFDNAQFRVMGLPILWLPRMRLPDPTLTRATGLLIPQQRSTDQLGLGLKLPYFIRLGDHRDLTLTPYISPHTRTLEARYRQAYLTGDIEVNAAITNDDLVEDTRGYLFAEGEFRLTDDAKLRFGVQMASDDAYLLDYGYSTRDRLVSEMSYEKVSDREMILGSVTAYQTLRNNEDGDLLPPLLLEASWERRSTPTIGGTLSYGVDLQGHLRTSDIDISGRDALRIGAELGWTRSHVTGGGLIMDGSAGLSLDAYSYADDATADSGLRATAHVAATLSYPLMRRTARATHVIEPVLALAWSDTFGSTPVNEDSTATEFDQTNLFALSRFSGEDAVETGPRAALGVSWTRDAPGGWKSRLTFGRVFRAEAAPDFTYTSGLQGSRSDWLIAGRLDMPAGFSVDARAVLGTDLSVTRSEARAEWSSARIDLGAGYIFLPEDLAEDRPNAVSEWTIDSTYRINDIWTVGLDARYDVAAGEPTQAGLQVGWQNECVTVDFSVSRRFTSSSTVQPTTDFGLSVGLNGFSAGRAGATPDHRCGN